MSNALNIVNIIQWSYLRKKLVLKPSNGFSILHLLVNFLSFVECVLKMWRLEDGVAMGSKEKLNDGEENL